MLVTPEAFEERTRLFAKRMDIDPPKVKVVPREAGTLAVEFPLETVIVQSHALSELTPAELDFALALAMSYRVRHRFWLIPIWLVPIPFGIFIGTIIVLNDPEPFIRSFDYGVAAIFLGGGLGYLASEILNAWGHKRYRNAVFHDAMVLTGNANAAESYLIRLQAERGKVRRRRTLSARRRDELESQLSALEYACDQLGITYRSVKQTS